DLPPAVIPGQPQPPAVILADRKNGIWNRTAVTGQQPTPKDQGTATELVNAQGLALPAVNTALAVDGQGKHRVVWATPTGLFYADDTGGSFGPSDQITKTAAQGASIAVAPDGTPWVSFYEGNAVKVVHRSGSAWAAEVVVGDAGQLGAPATVTAIRVGR